LRTRPLLWADDSALIFVSEHAGWLHAYRLDLRTRKVVDLTPGECELMQGAVAGGSYFASTNCGDRDRRHLWRVDLKSARSKALTRGTQIEMNPAPLAGGKLLAYSRATATDPQSIYVMTIDGTEVRRVSPPAPASLPTEAMSEPRPVTFPSASDGATIYGQLFQSGDPKFKGRKRPAVVYLHGGPVRQSVAGWYNIDYYDRFYAMNQYLASKGYVVLAVNYRAGTGYGRDYRLAKGIGPNGALEHGDVVGGGEYLRSLQAVDGERIGIYGASYGGYLTAMALARASALFKAGVDVHGVHDWAWHSATFGYAKGAGWAIVGDDAMKLAHASSPAASLDGWRSPVLLIHGDDDENVRFGHSIFLANALRERNVTVETMVFPDEIHGILRYETWRSLIERSVQFFDEHLQ
jgi:dipeptidyl aminopeptidase/acylaminoacyl peptidase